MRESVCGWATVFALAGHQNHGGNAHVEQRPKLDTPPNIHVRTSTRARSIATATSVCWAKVSWWRLDADGYHILFAAWALMPPMDADGSRRCGDAARRGKHAGLTKLLTKPPIDR